MKTHDSGPEWLARPSPHETFTHYLPSVLPTHPLITTSHYCRNGVEMGRSSVNNSPRQISVVGGAGRGLKPAADRAWVLSEGHGYFSYIVAEVLHR